jgi:hypothetical protein
MGRIWSRQQEVVISDQSLPQSVHNSADLFVRLIGQVSYSVLFNSKLGVDDLECYDRLGKA